MDKPVVREIAPAAAAVTGEAPAPALDEAALAAYGCDVAFVGDESMPPGTLLADAIEQVPDPQLKPLLSAAYERLRAIYDGGEAGGMISHPSRLRAVVGQTAAANGIDPTSHSLQRLLPFFDRLNRVLFQHQTLAWLTSGGSNLQLRIYGKGWENHPTFREFARGPIENPQVRRAVWQASRINLACSPFGAASDDVLAGVAAGAFYLMRFCPADLIERFYPPIADFCRAHQITTTSELRKRAPRPLRRLIGFASRTLGMDVLSEWDDFVAHLLDVTATGRVRSAAAIWPSYGAVCFHSRDDLLAQCTRWLYDGPERKRVAEEMRRQLIEAGARVSVSVSVDRDLLERLSASSEVAA